MTLTRTDKALRVASVLALIALALIAWSIVSPTPLPVLVGLSLGQAIGTASFLIYLVIVARELGLKRALTKPPAGTDDAPPS
jgi:hypothetical protein